MIVEADRVADDARGVLDALEAVVVNALLLEGADDALDHAILLRAMRGTDPRGRTRWGFNGNVAPSEISSQYLNKSVLKRRGQASPVSYRLS